MILIIIVLIILFGGFGHFYGGTGGAYPYRSYALPSVGTLLVILLIVYLLGGLR